MKVLTHSLRFLKHLLAGTIIASSISIFMIEPTPQQLALAQDKPPRPMMTPEQTARVEALIAEMHMPAPDAADTASAELVKAAHQQDYFGLEQAADAFNVLSSGGLAMTNPAFRKSESTESQSVRFVGGAKFIAPR